MITSPDGMEQAAGRELAIEALSLLAWSLYLAINRVLSSSCPRLIIGRCQAMASAARHLDQNWLDVGDLVAEIPNYLATCHLGCFTGEVQLEEKGSAMPKGHCTELIRKVWRQNL